MMTTSPVIIYQRHLHVAPTDPKLADKADVAIDSVISGPRGTHLTFKIKASTNLRTSTFLFERLGSTFNFGANAYYFIDTIVRVTGATTGYKIDIPIRFIKKQ